MAYDRIEKFPDANTAQTSGGKTSFTFPLEFRHHAHVWRGKAKRVSDDSEVTDIADIIDTLEYKLNSRVFRVEMTIAELRFLQNTYETDKYAGNQPNTVIVNFREWQNQIQGDQDVHSIATGGGVNQFTVNVKLKPGLYDVDIVEDSRIICDDGVFTDIADKQVKRLPLLMTRTIERLGIQNSAGLKFTLPQIDLRTGSIKRVTFMDGGKIDLIEVIHNNSVVQYITRDTMKMMMLDVVGVSAAAADTANRFTLPIDFLNRGLSGIGMKEPDGTNTNLKFRVTTNTNGGFEAFIERVENPLNTAA